MNTEKIPENGKRIDRKLFTRLILELIDRSISWDDKNGEYFCIFCKCDINRPTHVTNNRTPLQQHAPGCIYLIAEGFKQEFKL